MNLYNQTMQPLNENIRLIDSITDNQKDQVINLTSRYLELAEQCFKKRFASIPVVFDLQGDGSGHPGHTFKRNRASDQ